jgi:hypothetical protein
MFLARRLAFVPLFLLTAVAGLSAQESAVEPSEQEAIEAAQEVALSWVALVDAGEYEASWDQAAGGFQDAVTPASWETSVIDARKQFEPFGEREEIESQYLVDPPGAPAGEYVLLRYRTQVSGDRTVVETILPMKEGEVWKVGGYFVAPE